MPTLDPADYLADHLGTRPTPMIVYREVGKYAPAEALLALGARSAPVDDGPRRDSVKQRAGSGLTRGRSSTAARSQSC